ncbi:GntR family transcriptional regulator [Methylobacterium crusticola]|uniref:GntR family transcriptional regulator n=1 Tax=Methylobacterium crusticola TaxID=1697972 RepID=UPI001396AE3E|nr:GntR family transcriptional regulator [Methylobacterium crusticola]
MQRLIDTLSLSDQVRHYLLEALTSGRLRPGDRINEAELARTLGISRNPVREAVSGLAQRGFLVSAPRRGHFLRRFTPQDVDDVFSFRICVESFAVRQALPRMRPGDHDDLARLVERMVAAARGGRLADLHQADMALHRRICELSGNRQTLRAHEGIDTEVQMLIAYVDLEREPPMHSALAHLPVVEALASGDVERAVAAMRHHLETTWAFVHRMYGRAGRGEPPGEADERAGAVRRARA